MCITAVCSLNYGIGICSFLISIAKDIAVDLDCISESVKTKGNRAFVLKRLSEIIQLHSNVKQLSIYFKPSKCNIINMLKCISESSQI